MAMSLFESRVEDVIKDGINRLTRNSEVNWAEQVKKNWDFYNGNQLSYFKIYPGEKPEEFQAKSKCIFNYTGRVVDEYVSGVYQLPVNRTFKTETNNKIIEEISEYFQLQPFFKKVQKIAEVSNMCGVIIRKEEATNRLYLEEIPGEYIKIYPNKKYVDGIEQVVIAYNFDNQDGCGVCTRVEGWSREKVVIYVVRDKKAKLVFSDDNIFRDENGQQFIPISFFRPDEDTNSLYGKGDINSIVSINETYNTMWSDIVRIVKMQSFSVLVVRRPRNDRDEAPEHLQIAPTRMLEDYEKDFDAKYITPDPKINESLNTLSALRKELLDLSKVPSGSLGDSSKLGVESMQTLRAKRIPIENVWEQRKTSYRYSERDLFKKVILASKIITNKGDTNDLFPKIDYSEKMKPIDIKEQAEKDKADLALGLTNPTKLYLREDPDIGGMDEAENEVIENLKTTKKILGIGAGDNQGDTIDDFMGKIQKFKQVSHQVKDELDKKDVTKKP